MSRRAERFEQARKRRRSRRNLILAGVALALVVGVAVIVLAASGLLSRGVTTADLLLIEPTEAYSLVQSGEAALYDVRPADAYQILHAEGALSLPEADVRLALADLPPDRVLILY